MTLVSSWVWESMKPGVSVSPWASIEVAASIRNCGPMRRMESSRMATSTRSIGGAPLPSMITALRMMVSQVGCTLASGYRLEALCREQTRGA